MTYKKHTIELSDAANYRFEHQIAGSYGLHENKELKAVVNRNEVLFEVWSYKKRVITTPDLNVAVVAYNHT